MAPWKDRHKRNAVSVTVLESNPLAATRLREILRQSGTVKLFRGDRYGAKPTRDPDVPLVVVIDRDTHAEPLDDLLHRLQCEAPRAKALVIGRSVPREDICRLLFSGAGGFLPYQEVRRRLTSAIRSVSAGRLWAEPDALEEYAQRAAKLWERERNGKCRVTPAEKRVLALLQLRLSNKEIASEMEISERTVKFHLGNAFTKLGVHDRYSLIDMLKSGKLSGPGVAMGRGKDSEG